MRSNFEVPRSARALVLGAGVAAGAAVLTQTETAAYAEKAGEPTSTPLKFVKPFDTNTFYTENLDAGKSMGEGNPRGFDMGPSTPLKFFVTGPIRIQFQLFPWVHVDEVKRRSAGPLQVAVTIDEDDKREIPPQPLPVGKVFAATKVTSGTDEIALWDNPLVLPWIDIPRGNHEITVTSTAYGFRVMPVGPQETSKPDIEQAIERPFEEDPTMPPRFRFACQLDPVAGTPAGLALREVTQSPMSLRLAANPNGLAVQVQRLHDDTRVHIRLTLDGVQYDLARPLEQGTGHMCEFERTEPPVRSTDSSGPTEFPLLIKPDGTVIDSTMQCHVYSKAAAVMCWETDIDSRIRAYRARLDKRDTTPTGKGRRHLLRKY